MLPGQWHGPRAAWSLLAACFHLGFVSLALGTEPAANYRVQDPQWTVKRLDSSSTDSFLSIRADSMGRLFVGGRESLFVYEPDANGGYAPRRELVRFPPDTWINDIEILGTDVYVSTITAIYVIPGAVNQREGLVPKRILWGLPFGHVHQGFHALAWGPEGDLYIAVGDTLWFYGDFQRPDHWGHWTFFGQPDGKGVPYTGMGCVLRCRPDGGELRVVARGTRNSCGIAFDRAWNLFANDNDHESLPAEYVPGRLMLVTPHGFLGWPRGWMPSKSPDRADLLDTMFEGMGRSVPVGQAYYDEPFFAEKYRANFFVARWDNRTVTRYPLRPFGASFKTDEFTVLEATGDARPVGVTVGRGGRLFVVVAYMRQNELSPIYQSDLLMITRADDPDSRPFEPIDLVAASVETLNRQLGSSSWQARYLAHQELLRRGVARDHLTPLTDPAEESRRTPHALWLTAALTADEQAGVERAGTWAELTRVLSEGPPPLRLQAVRILGEFYAQDPNALAPLLAALADPEPSVQLAALVALFPRSEPVPPTVAAGPARSEDTYLRQLGTLLLARRASLDDLGGYCDAPDPATRLAGVLAVGFRLTVPEATAVLSEELPLRPWPTEAVYLPRYFDGPIDLRKLGRIGLFTVAEHWNARPRFAEQEFLFQLLRARLDDSDSKVRLQAAYFLSLLHDQRTEDLITKTRADSARARLVAVAPTPLREAWVAGPFADGESGLKLAHPPETGAIQLSATYDSGGRMVSWSKCSELEPLDFSQLAPDARNASFYVYTRLQSGRRQPILLQALSPDGVRVWHNGRLVLSNERDAFMRPKDPAVLLELQPGSNDLLVRVQHVTCPGPLRLGFRSLDPVAVVLPENVGVADLATRLKAAGDGPVPVAPEFLAVDWVEAVKNGDVDQGRKLFGVDGIGCAKCHAVGSNSSVEGAPSLVGAGKRFTVPDLVESILLPNQRVAPIFRATLVATTSGALHTGLVVAETADHLEMLLPDATRIRIPQADIEERSARDLSPMPAGLVRTPNELRDLLAYLLSQQD